MLVFDDENRTFGGTLLGAALVGTGTYLTVQLTRDGQVADRFTKAIEQLGKNELDVRLGGIYALERLAFDSSRDREPIMEVLTAFVRSHAPWPERSGTRANEPSATEVANAVQAIVAVLGRREVGAHDLDLDLSSANLSGMKFGRGDFRRAILLGANLEGTDLTLGKAKLAGAHYNSKTVPPKKGFDLSAEYGAHRIDGPISTCPACKGAERSSREQSTVSRARPEG